MFRELQAITERPPVHSQETIAALWTDPHISEQMLRFHLDGSVAISSGTTESIDAAVAWIQDEFDLAAGSRVLDLGCGPGLYANRLARSGIAVTGVDFSARSIAHARATAASDGLQVTYVNEDYLAWQPDGRFDLVMMIMRDYGALLPAGRRALLARIASLLEPGGAFLFDVDSMAALEARADTVSFTAAPQGGFWAPDPYFEFHGVFRYAEDAAALDRFVIVEADRTRSFFVWTQHFTPESLEAELAAAGLVSASVMGDVAGRPFDERSPEFAVVARLR